MPKVLVTKTAGKHYQAMVATSKARAFLDEDVFVENSSYARHHIKRRVIEKSLIKYACSECNLEGNWNNKPLSLQLDHINGVNNDHRISNLRFLCPNCHTQQDTYAAKNIGKVCRSGKMVIRRSPKP